ncbi:MAG: enoyl-CoA hydratase/isomerase family protein [Burkholderiales bacterium]|nr:enoyl-CoA hydratase/isomerase family protein [Burkholderiales bacterium]
MAHLTIRHDGPVTMIELARADRGNALNRALQTQLAQAWEAFENDDARRVAVLHGAPEVFSIGHDVRELADDLSLSPLVDDGFYPLHLSKPVIAAIEGPCYGLGFELALACDLRVAGAGSRFGFPDRNLHVPYRVAAVLLPRMTFLGASLEMIEAGRVSDAADMRACGLVSELAERGAAANRAIALAQEMAKRFGAGRDFRKQAIWGLSGVPLPAAMRNARG